MHNTIFGRIIVPYGAVPQKHELFVANILIRTGDNVSFIPVSLTPTADLLYKNLEWEVKSPLGASYRAIERNLYRATHQSSNIILDLHRINLDEHKCLLYLRNHIQDFRNIKRLLVITKSQKILKISPKNGCIKEIPVLK